jgi:hypothetical protein
MLYEKKNVFDNDGGPICLLPMGKRAGLQFGDKAFELYWQQNHRQTKPDWAKGDMLSRQS